MAQADRHLPTRAATPIATLHARKVAVLGQAASAQGLVDLDLAPSTQSTLKTDTIAARRSKVERHKSQRPYEEALCQALFNMSFEAVSKSSTLCHSLYPPKPQLHDYRPTIQPKVTAAPCSKRRPVDISVKVILDLPGITADFYGQPFSCSSKNMLAVALGQKVYTKTLFPSKKAVETVYEHDTETIPALSWLSCGTKLALGLSNGHSELVDYETKKSLRTLVEKKGSASGQRQAFDCAKADTASLVVSDLKQAINFVDLRKKTVLVFNLNEPLGGFSLSPSTPTLALGTMKGLHIYDTRNFKKAVAEFPHNGAVKAMVWAPWNPQHLFTGGGVDDRCIRLFDIARGELLDQVDTGSQVCTLQASEYYRELVSTHGREPITLEPTKNNCILWQCATKQLNYQLTPCEEFQAHTTNALFSQLTADQSVLVTASPDETLRTWNIFERSNQKKPPAVNSKPLQLDYAPTIR